MAASRNIFILFCVLCARVIAFDPDMYAGWQYTNVFYPPDSASPRFRDTNLAAVVYAKDVWAADFQAALNEREWYIGGNGDRDIIGVVRWENENVQALKDFAFDIVTAFLDLGYRDNSGTYAGYFSSLLDISNFDDPESYLIYVSGPPAWTHESILQHYNLPPGFWTNTPARYLGASVSPIVVTVEGTNEWTSLDYGWHGLAKVVSGMQDFIGDGGGVWRAGVAQTSTCVTVSGFVDLESALLSFCDDGDELGDADWQTSGFSSDVYIFSETAFAGNWASAVFWSFPDGIDDGDKFSSWTAALTVLQKQYYRAHVFNEPIEWQMENTNATPVVLVYDFFWVTNSVTGEIDTSSYTLRSTFDSPDAPPLVNVEAGTYYALFGTNYIAIVDPPALCPEDTTPLPFDWSLAEGPQCLADIFFDGDYENFAADDGGFTESDVAGEYLFSNPIHIVRPDYIFYALTGE